MHKYITTMFVLSLSGCAITNSNCGLPADVVSKVKQYNRGPINGAIDNNHDGKIDQYEAFGIGISNSFQGFSNLVNLTKNINGQT